MASKPDCRTCGACCVALQDQEGFCDVTEKDVERLGKRFTRLHVVYPSTADHLSASLTGQKPSWGAIRARYRKQRSGPLKGIEANACVCLRGSLLKRVSCSIYDKRPEVCRKAVRPGDRTCRWLRSEFQRLASEA